MVQQTVECLGDSALRQHDNRHTRRLSQAEDEAGRHWDETLSASTREQWLRMQHPLNEKTAHKIWAAASQEDRTLWQSRARQMFVHTAVQDIRVRQQHKRVCV